jgi:DNA-binding beta-propeller fold protein YncE
MSRLLLLTAASTMLLAAQTPLAGPSLGFIFDAQGQVLRPIRGIPGASMIGEALPASAPFSAAAVSLKQNLAVAYDGAWKWVPLATPGDPVLLPDGLPSSARLALSENGSAAAFYDATAGALSVVTGIATANTALNAVTLSALPGAITAMAIADDGALLLSASITDDAGNAAGEALFWIGADGSTRQLATLQTTASILLTNRGASALVTDRAANQVWKIQDPGGNAALTLLASDADGVSSPAGAALSADSKQLWIANAGAHNVLGVRLSDRTTTSLACSFDATMLASMSDGQTFRLNELGTGPLWILDAGPDVDARIVFIPALPSPTTVTQEATQ